MSKKKVTPGIDDAVRKRLEAIRPLLRMLSEEENEEGYFTDDGASMVRAVQSVAWEASAYLADEFLGETTGPHDVRLLRDAQRFLAVTSCALNKLDPTGHHAVESPWMVSYLLELAEGLQRRAEAKGQSVIADNGDLEEAEEPPRSAETVSEARRALLAGVVELRERLAGHRDAEPLGPASMDYLAHVIRPRISVALKVAGQVFGEGVTLTEPEATALGLVYHVLHIADELTRRATAEDDGTAVAGVYVLLTHAITTWHESAVRGLAMAQSAA